MVIKDYIKDHKVEEEILSLFSAAPKTVLEL